MELDKQLRSALASAEQVTAERQRIQDAIVATEAELPQAISNRLEAEQALGVVESAAALGQADAHQLAKARKRLTEARERLDSIAARLSGLKSRLNAQGLQLAACQDELEPLATDHMERIQRDFADEWNHTAVMHGHSMAKRLALEAATGQKLNLLDPTSSAEPVDLGEVARPFEVLRALESAIAAIQQTKQLEARDRARIPLNFDPDGVYELLVTPPPLNGKTFNVGDRLLGKTLGLGAMKFLLDRRMVRRVDALAVAGS